MLYFKACPKCRGDVEPNSDMYGAYLKCFQCGFNKDLSPEMATRLELDRSGAPQLVKMFLEVYAK